MVPRHAPTGDRAAAGLYAQPRRHSARGGQNSRDAYQRGEVVLADVATDLPVEALREIVNFMRYVHQREIPPQ